MDLRSIYWYQLNDKLANKCSDGDITEEEMESVLDEAQLIADSDQMGVFCEQHDIELEQEDETF